MFYISEIHCKENEDNWSFKNCLFCEQFTCQKVPKGWTCSCAMNTDPKDKYHYDAIWETELCILWGTLAPGNRMDVRIKKINKGEK